MRTAYCSNCKDNTRFYTDYGEGKTWLRYCTECENDINYNYKLCILAAGRGTRSKDVDGLHKALLPIENKPVISHIIDKFDSSVDIVIATGYKSEQIKTYINETYSEERNITYVDVDNYDGPNSGPGYSLLCCKEELQCPFIYTAVDTIVDIFDEDILSFVNENWIGVSKVSVEESVNYCLVKGNKYLDDLYYGKGNQAYVGLAAIAEYENFWHGLENQYNYKEHFDNLHEYQVDNGFRGLDIVRIVKLKWYDTGNSISYAKVKKVFNNDIVANKSDEAIFINKNKVIKYFTDSNKVKTRIERIKYLNGNCPNVRLINDNMYAYDYIDGEPLSEFDDPNVFKNFLNFYQTNLMSNETKDDSFIEDCKNMYQIKTINRLKKMSETKLDKIKLINGIEVESISKLINRIDWDEIYNYATPSRFHGDLQLENIIYDNNDFILIDWRESFGKSRQVGDIYYDLGKLWHSLPVNGRTILKNIYQVDYNDKVANVEYYFRSNLLEFYFVFKDFCEKNDYNWKIITLSGILHYLNICTLYGNFQGGKYGDFLFLLGKLMLTKNINGDEVL